MANISFGPQMVDYPNSSTFNSSDRNHFQSLTWTLINLLNINLVSVSSKQQRNYQKLFKLELNPSPLKNSSNLMIPILIYVNLTLIHQDIT